jgi:hypothetical protein
MNRYIFCLLFLFLLGCSGGNRSDYVISEKERAADEDLRKAAIELMTKAGLEPCGSGGQMMDQVKMLALSFDYKGPIQIEDARKLLIQSVDTLVAVVNNDPLIRPYLYNYPFEPKNVEIRIFLRGADQFDVPLGELVVISSIKGTFDYDIRHLETRRLTTIFEETYAEAKQKVGSSE